MKYKLLKDLPKVSAGEIFKEHKVFKNLFTSESNSLSYLRGFIDDNPDWFAPYLFTTDDGVDIFEGDYSYCWNKEEEVEDDSWKDCWTGSALGEEDYKYFSTKEAAEKYINSLKPQFEEGVWYHRNRCDALYIGDGKGVGFVDGISERWRDDLNMSNPKWWTKSDLKEVEKLLIHKAKEDYPEGTRFSDLGFSGKERTSHIDPHFYNKYYLETTDKHYFNIAVSGISEHVIYQSGKWANIIEKPIIKTDDGKFWYPSDFVEGKVIHVSYNDGHYPNNWIIECRGNDGSIINSAASVTLSSEDFYMNSEGVWGALESDYKIREATPEEKELLQKCKYAGKFVKGDELVMVIDSDECYSRYISKAKELKLQKWEFGDEPENNKVYRAVKEFYDKEECTAIQDLITKQTFIMGNQGLQPIKKV